MMNVARGLALVISGGFPISELPSSFRFWGGLGGLDSGAGDCGGGVLRGVPRVSDAHHGGPRYLRDRRNSQAALLSGVPVDARLILVYALSGVTAAAGAIVLAGRMNSGFPLAGMGGELDSIAR